MYHPIVHMWVKMVNDPTQSVLVQSKLVPVFVELDHGLESTVLIKTDHCNWSNIIT
jgi:hypothetical protein